MHFMLDLATLCTSLSFTANYYCEQDRTVAVCMRHGIPKRHVNVVQQVHDADVQSGGRAVRRE